MEAHSWQELEALVHSYSAIFNHIQVSALVCRLPKLVPAPAQLPQPEKTHFSRFLREVSELVGDRLSTFDPRAIANVLWAVSKLGYSPSPPTLNKFLFEAYVRMYDFNAQELANLGWALATLAALGNRPVPVWLRKYTLAAVPRVPELKPQEVAHMTWALSKLFPEGVASIAAAAAAATPSQEQRQNEQQLGEVALGAAGASARRGVASEGQQGAGSAPPGAAEEPSGRQQMPASASATTGNVSGGAAAQQLPTAGSSTGGSASVDIAAALPELIYALTAHALELVPRFKCGDLVVSILSIQNMDLPVGLRLLRRGLPHLLRAAPRDLTAQDLSNLWQVLGRFAADASLGAELLSPDCSSSSSTTTAIASIGSNNNNNLHAVSLSMAAAARDGTGPWQHKHQSPPLGRHHLHALLDVTIPALHGFTAQGLCVMLWAWARLRLAPGDAAVAAVFRRFGEVLPSQATFQGVAISLWAAAQLGLRPPVAAMERFEACARLQLPASKSGERRALLWALQEMGYRPSAALLDALSGWMVGSATQLQAGELQWVLRAYDMFDVPLPRRLCMRALEVATTVGPAVAEDGHAGADAVAAASAPALAWPATQQPAAVPAKAGAYALDSGPLRLSPRAAVAYFAALVGVGTDVVPNGARRRAAERKVQLMRWRLEVSAEARTALRASVEGAVQGRLRTLAGGTLCALLAAMVRLHLRPRPAFLREVYDEVAARVGAGGLSLWHAGTLLAALGRLHPRPRPPAEVLAALLALLEPHLGDLPDGNLLSVVQALARLRYRPSGAWLRGYFAECMARVDGWPAAHLEVFLGSLAALGLRLSGAACRQLQVVVYRRKGRGRDEAGGASRKKRGARPGAGEGAAQEPVAAAAAKGGSDLKRSLCTLCSELSGCAV